MWLQLFVMALLSNACFAPCNPGKDDGCASYGQRMVMYFNQMLNANPTTLDMAIRVGDGTQDTLTVEQAASICNIVHGILEFIGATDAFLPGVNVENLRTFLRHILTEVEGILGQSHSPAEIASITSGNYGHGK